VQDVSGGDQTIILSSGMAIKSLPSPKSIPPMVDNLRLKNNVASGQASLLWNALKRVDAYSVQMSQTPADETSWTDVGMSTKRSITLTGLPGTTLCWFRVAGFNAAGLGAWSSPVQKVIS
jgi:hypothetical protein